jgi:hypothetical protein
MMLAVDDSERRRKLETVFPWARFLPPLAQREFMNVIDSYHSAADTYARQARKSRAMDAAIRNLRDGGLTGGNEAA